MAAQRLGRLIQRAAPLVVADRLDVDLGSVRQLAVIVVQVEIARQLFAGKCVWIAAGWWTGN
jgi:hypothetical protein